MNEYNKDNLEKYKQKIMDGVTDFAYRRKRYAIDYSVVMGLTRSDIDIEKFIFSKRQTDIVIALEKNLYCVVFDATPLKYAIHAISNLKVRFKKEHSDASIFISAVNSKDYYNEDEMSDSIFEILDYAIYNDMEGLVTDFHEMGHSSKLNKNTILN
ncbi:hypothetical protein N9A28_06235 [Sulfurimonas sp.]|nr:hypothetical protein [Sulfurimonas sp.]